MKVTKELILKALATEPLRIDRWFHFVGPYGDDLMTCEVCAVGAILRTALGETELRKAHSVERLAIAATHGYYVDDESELLLSRGNYLGALSNTFENNGMNGMNTSQNRKACIDYVIQNFPDDIEMNLEYEACDNYDELEE